MTRSENRFFEWGNDILKYFGDKTPLLFHWSRFTEHLPKHFNVYQTEQLHSGHVTEDSIYQTFLSKADTIYDYSIVNLKYRDDLIFRPFLPDLDSKYDNTQNKDIDILFYGTLTERRMEIINSLKQDTKMIIDYHNIYLPKHKLEEKIKRSRYVLSYGGSSNTFNDSIRVTRALNAGANILMERGYETWYDEYLTKNFKHRVNFL